MERNEVVIDGRLLKRDALRYTPAGIPVIDAVIEHSSMQTEAGGQRRTRCEINATAIGEMAGKLGAAKLNQVLRISGFLAQHSVGNRKLVLHVVKVDPIGSERQ